MTKTVHLKINFVEFCWTKDQFCFETIKPDDIDKQLFQIYYTKTYLLAEYCLNSVVLQFFDNPQARKVRYTYFYF